MNKIMASVAIALAPLFLFGDDFVLYFLDPPGEMARSWTDDPIPYDEATAKLAADTYFTQHTNIMNGAHYEYVKTTFVTTNVASFGTATIGWILDVDATGPEPPNNQFAIGFAVGIPHPVSVGRMVRPGASGNNVTRETIEKTVFDCSIRTVVDNQLVHGVESRYANLVSRARDPRWRDTLIGAATHPGVPYTIDGPLVTEE